ncbi:hypothetical protein LIER_24665 [Lithospermum erythrorhizon]|uniref:Integrase catalytic domain-containing protein n=1 Tax=Lithospermum erythrorhizon TaxID=34254 RepID=A0AAV3R7W4_LITER
MFENLCIDVTNEGMKLDKIFLAKVLLEKFPPSWSEYRNHLKHKKRDMPFQELISHMRTEEANRLKGKDKKIIPNSSTNANLIEIAIQKTPQAYLVKSDDVIADVVVEANLIANDWVLDTRASRYLCAKIEMFQDFEEVVDEDTVYMRNSATAGITGKGKVSLKLTFGKTLALSNVLYAPTLLCNLVSATLLNKAGLKLICEADKVVLSCSGEFVGKGYLSGGLFLLNVDSFIKKNGSTSAFIIESLDVWHGRLGHVNVASIKRVRALSIIPDLSTSEFSKCPICLEAKFTKKPCNTVTIRQSNLLDLIHTDLADFKNTRSKGGKNNYITLTKDCSRYTRVYLLRSKNEAEEIFIKFKNEVENQLDKKIKRTRSDRGGEYGSESLIDFCERNGIIHETSAPYLPQQNGIFERKNRSLKNMMNVMLLSSSLPDEMWGETI